VGAKPAWFRFLQRKSRTAKYQAFMERLAVDSRTRILDLGCGPGTYLEDMHPYQEGIICLDIRPDLMAKCLDRHPAVRGLIGDGCCLPFESDSIDVVFCNGVIEHLPPSMRGSFASEIRRVSRAYWVVTPNRASPLDPHSKLPFLHWCPPQTHRHLLGWAHRCRLLGMSPGYYYEMLSASELRRLFPEAEVSSFMMGAHLIAWRDTSHVQDPEPVADRAAQ